ncbi:UDP-glucose dehydrogenase family protein [Niallia sp. 03133]|uniref:UDP-glucose dehydrogenase family protein n=1 Tax=Niallia sp. 03133 TaxID=3458060 RepID=UPI0040449F41
MMKIAVIGTGYVGLSTGVCLAEIGHHVTCIDIDINKINLLQLGNSPIYEPGMEQLLTKNIENGKLLFSTTHKEGLQGVEVIILAVGTPQGENGAADLTILQQAAKDIADYLHNNPIIVIKSTVPVGTNDSIKEMLEDHCKKEILIVSNPEFLRQGSAIYDTMNPDRIIIGSYKKEASEKIQKMYSPLNAPVLITSVRSAEMIKYASNAFLANKISYINFIANLCEQVGANVDEVSMGIGKDKRIGNAFLQAGIGYGGSCFPKDVKALLHTSLQFGLNASLLEETIAINDSQQELLVVKALQRFGSLNEKKVALLGLAFKPETDDMREAPSIKIAKQLTKMGAEVAAYDPAAIDNAKKILGDIISYTQSIKDAIKNADAIFIVTEWKEIKNIELSSVLKEAKLPIIFDGRNCLNKTKIMECDSIEYYSIGRPAIIKK